jgi:uncharacterized repeat protein (TIGR01451 family)
MLKHTTSLFVLLAVLSGAGVASAQTHKLRVNDPAVAKALIDRGGKLIADYGGFQLIETSETPAVGRETGRIQNEDRSDIIELNVRHLNTRAPEIRALRRAAGAFTGKRLHMVHFAGPIKSEWLAELEKSGGRIISYVPNNAYLIYGDAPALARMQAWAGGADYVQWEGNFENDYKIHPGARLTDEKGQPQPPITDTFAVQLVDDAEANAATLGVIDRLRLGPVQSQYRVLNYLNVIVRLPPDRLNEIAAQPEVVSIQPYYDRHMLDERQDQIVAGNLSGSSPTGPGYLAWLASKGFTQAQFTNSGFVVDVSDSGVDNGTTTPGHYALYQFGNPSLSSRVIYNRLEGTANGGSTLQGCDGHGNLNAHIIAGFSDLSTNGFLHTDSTGYSYDLGICPFVKVGSSVIFDPSSFTSPSYPKLQGDAYRDGARISANSWGADVAGVYDVDAQAYDALVRNASTNFAGTNRQMVIVFSAGNAGSGTKTINSPSSAKNVIAVGATENVRSMSTANGGNSASGNDGSSISDTGADNANDIISFSSRGPCADGRMKPDIVAPGTHITGGAPQSGAATTNGTGTAISCFDGSGVSALSGGGTVGNANNFFPLGQQFYTESSGTSHSTPCVAGACALLRQYFINNGLTPPSPAMTKASLINSARYMTGVSANDNLWSPNQGMGELNLGAAFDGVPRVLRDQVAVDTFNNTGTTRVFTGTINDPTKPFRVTLAWTDAPGSTTGNAFNNDLDLTVTIAGVVTNTYLGNVFSGAFSVVGGSADARNNVESVFLPADTAGNFTVTVSAANITSDGVPNVAPALDQDFALAIYNATQASTPSVLVDNFSLLTEDCGSPNGAIDPGETVAVGVRLRNFGSANTTSLVVTLLATNGVTSPGTPQAIGVLLTNGVSTNLTFTFTASGSCGGTITPTFQLQDGAVNLGKAAFSLSLGQLVPVFTENFDSVTPPALPASWTTSAGGGQSAWVTTSSVRDSLPNSMFSPDPASVGSNALVSPNITLSAGPAQLAFRNNYNLESGFDGGVLEIKIGAGAFTDILTAGGSFISGGYNRTISSSFNSSIAGRQAWSGNSGGFITTIVSLPAAASGQTVQLRWRCATDTSTAKTGWYIDSLVISNNVCGNCAVGVADLVIAQSASPTPLNVTSNLTFTINVTNLGPNSASTVVVTDSLPAGLTFTSATVSQGTSTNNGNLFSAALGTMTNTARATITIQAIASAAGQRTNTATVSSGTTDSNPANNTASAAFAVNSPPTITGITNVITAEDVSAGPIGFVIGDTETAAASLTLSATSSDISLVDPASIVFGGNGANRTVTLTPSTNQNGASTITLTVSDGMAVTNTSFTLTVTPVNDPPVLNVIPNFTIFELSTLNYTNKAGDIDLPPQTLTFSLLNAPAGASINTNSGVFTWTPTEAQGPGTNANIAIIVTDNGVPPLSATQFFTIFVLETNSAPVLAPISDRTVHAGMFVAVTNSASDTDAPPNVLTFTLDTAPTGAGINSSNGLFGWQTSDSEANTTNPVTVRVTDNGVPHQSDTRSFVITVVPGPFMEFVSLSNSIATMQWSSISGQTYRVVANGSLVNTNWTNLVPDVTALGTNTTATDAVGTNMQKFYRVRLVP